LAEQIDPADWVRRFGAGDLIAAATLQPKMEILQTAHGFWAYRQAASTQITLGGPICAPAHRQLMVDRFLAHARRPVFCYIRQNLVEILGKKGLHCAGMGIDRWVDLKAFLSAPAREVLGARKKAAKAGVVLTEASPQSLTPALTTQLNEISSAYLAAAEVQTEMTFLNRPLDQAPDPDRRVFLLGRGAEQAGEIFGFAVLNPVFQNGKITAYLLDLLRYRPSRVWGLWLSTVHQLAERLQREGVGLSLGYCPLHQVAAPSTGGSSVLQAQLDWMGRYLAHETYIRRLNAQKALIPGPSEQRYFASYSRSAATALGSLMTATGLPRTSLIGPDLVRTVGTGLRQRLGIGARP
jgi:phosphatidylglycerol lysyltransferase